MQWQNRKSEVYQIWKIQSQEIGLGLAFSDWMTKSKFQIERFPEEKGSQKWQVMSGRA